MSHLNTAFNLGASSAAFDFEKEAAGMHLPGGLMAKMLAGGAVGAGAGALAGGEGHRGSGALLGAGLGAGAGAGVHALDARALRGRVAAATEARAGREAEHFAEKRMREAAEAKAMRDSSAATRVSAPPSPGPGVEAMHGKEPISEELRREYKQHFGAKPVGMGNTTMNARIQANPERIRALNA